jgi:hypothetical protein
MLTGIGLTPATWSGIGGFVSLLSGTAPVFWLFFLLTGLSLFRLRQTAAVDRGHSCAALHAHATPVLRHCWYLLYSSIDYAWRVGRIGLLPVALGVLSTLPLTRKPTAADFSREPVPELRRVRGHCPHELDSLHFVDLRRPRVQACGGLERAFRPRPRQAPSDSALTPQAAPHSYFTLRGTHRGVSSGSGSRMHCRPGRIPRRLRKLSRQAAAARSG